MHRTGRRQRTCPRGQGCWRQGQRITVQQTTGGDKTMSKKLIISLAAFAALAVLPAAAQASVPHYFSNGVKLAESACKGEEIATAAACYGEEEVEGAAAVRVVNAWGTLELKGETGAAAGGLITCQ